MRFLQNFLLIIFLTIAGGHCMAQDLDARSPQHKASTGKQADAEKKKAKQQKDFDKAVKKAKKQHEKLQTKNTRKMMRKSRHQPGRWDQDRKEFFLKRWFRKKHR
ncbi:MAG: hypothetical protein U0X76_07245 [Bacteroidia bacterium]